MTAQSGDQRHAHTGSRRHTSATATISSKTRCNVSKKAVKVAASVFAALAVVLFLTVTFNRDDPNKGAAAGRDHHDLAGNGKRSALDIPVTSLPQVSQMRLRRGFLRGDNERASKDSSDELEDGDTIQSLSSSDEGKRREESFEIVIRDADAALKAADDAVKAGVVAVAAAAEEASDVSTVRK